MNKATNTNGSITDIMMKCDSIEVVFKNVCVCALYANYVRVRTEMEGE